jgi:hypothetical protein
MPLMFLLLAGVVAVAVQQVTQRFKPLVAVAVVVVYLMDFFQLSQELPIL